MIEVLHVIAASSSSLSKICPSNCGLPTPDANQSTVHTVFNIVLGIAGAIALLIITIAGLRFITSAGDPQKAASARSTIILALVGLAIAMSAYAIINFVIQGIQ